MKKLMFRGTVLPASGPAAETSQLLRTLFQSKENIDVNPWIEKAKRHTLRGSAAVKLAIKLEEEGKTWTHSGLTHGVLRHDIGDTHSSDEIMVAPSIQDAVCDAVRDKKISYTKSAGLSEIRKLIADAYGVRAEEVFFVNGVTEALIFTALLFTNTGGNMILTRPVYPPWAGILLLHGIDVHMADSENNSSGAPSIKSIESQIDQDTRGIVSISANNPTGLFNNIEIIELQAALLHKHMIATKKPAYLIVDDIYLTCIPLDKQIDYFAVSEAYGVPLVYMSGIDKTLGTGFHGGYIIIHIPELLKGMRDEILDQVNTIFAMYLGANTLTQYATIPYFERYEAIRAELESNFATFAGWSRAFIRAINNGNGIRYYFREPDLPFYHWLKLPPGIDSENFAYNLVERQGLSVTPGAPFGIRDGIRVAMVRDPMNPINIVSLINDLLRQY